MKVSLQRVARSYAAFLVLFCAIVVGFWYFGPHLFSILLERSRAYTPPQFLTWLSLASSVSIAVAFCIMPFSLFRIVRERSDVPFGWVVLCIAAFLFLCGVTSFFGLLTVWFHGPFVVWSLVATRLGTAFLAVATVLVLRALVPHVVKLPTHEEWVAVNNDLLRAEAQTEAKNKLLATVSHELRTPLAPLLGTLSELEQQFAPSERPAVHNCVRILGERDDDSPND